MKWYAEDLHNEQGLVIDEETGRNVAVAYDAKDAVLLASAPDLLRAAKAVLAAWEAGDLAAAMRELADTVANAEGGF